MKIKEMLTINLTEDIKNVIDLEDVSEAEIRSEIENYIVTDGLSQDYSKFVSTFTSNIVETGVWISGFYGSGKSYFGKLLGYLLNNRSIAGTPARDRILNRFTGISEEALVKNELAKLNKEKCRNCWARFFCSGGCHANADLFHGDIRQPYEVGCEIQKKRLECAILVQACLALEKSK